MESKTFNTKCWMWSLMVSLIFIIGFSNSVFADTITVNSPVELLPYLDDDSVNVKLVAGTYTITAADIANGTYGTPRFAFRGNNSTYDFTGVTINFAADIYTEGYSMSHIQVFGNNNVLKNLTMEDLCDKYGAKVNGGVNVIMDGSYNRIEGFHMTVRGSYPYGYGDCFGKGATYTIKHWKHSAFLIRGDYNHALNDTIYHYSYGHCMFMQAASHPKIEGCYLVGEVRSTDDMLAEEGTGSAADNIDFFTVWGYRLQPGFMKSTGEAGIRAYNAGNTVINGVAYERGTDNPTILNCYVKNLRVGVTLTHATGKKYVEGVTAIGTERGFAIGSGDIVNCSADAQYGAVFGVDYESDRNIKAEITVLPYEGETFNGSNYLAYIRGTGHNLIFKSAVDNPDQDLKIAFGGDATTIGEIATVQNNLANDVKLQNYTNYPIVLNENTKNNSGVTGGMVSDFGTNNNFTHTSVSVGKYEAEEYSHASEVVKETTTDEGGGVNVTSIESGDFMEYEIDVPYSGTYSINYRVSSDSVDGDFTVSKGSNILENVSFTTTGGAQTWTTVTSSAPLLLDKGKQTIKITANSAEWNFNWFDLTLECAKVVIVPYIEVYNSIGKIINTQNSFEQMMFPGNSLSLRPAPEIGGTWSWTGPDGFAAGTRVIELSDVDESDAGDYIATITNNCGQQSSDTFTITILGEQLIEAETYSNSSDVITEPTTDVGNGVNVSSIDAGDWMDYTIDVPVSATYSIDYRVASESNDGDFSLRVDGAVVDHVTFTNTGGAQNWETISSTGAVYLKEGTHTFRITANSGGWNFNWLKLLGQDYVSPCKLPFKHEGLMVQNDTVSWTTGLMDISCVSSVNVYLEMSETGTLSISDSLNVYYKLDGGDLTEILKNTGNLSQTVSILKELSGTTIEILVEGVSASIDNYYNVDKISVVETTDPFARIEAEDYNDMEGVGNSGTRLGSIQPGEWSMYEGLDLTGAKSIDASVGTVNSDAYIEVRLDKVDGTLIATIEVPNTGNYNSYSTASTYIDELTGIHDVYLVYQTVSSANVCNIDWFQFSEAFIKRPTNPFVRFEAEINDKESGTVVTTTSDLDGDKELDNLEEDDYIMFSALNLEEADNIKVRVASAVEGGIIEVRLGAVTGTIISFIDVPSTGSSSTWQTISTEVDDAEGENDVYFVFRGEGNDLFRLNWLQFAKQENTFARLQAEDNDSSFGNFKTGSTSDAADNNVGGILKAIKPGHWIQFNAIDLSSALSISTRFGTEVDDASIEVRLDASDGQLIGTIALNNTGDWHNWETTSTNLSDVSGTHDVYFVFQTDSSANVCNCNWFEFSAGATTEPINLMSRIEAENYDRARGTVSTLTSDLDGDKELGTIQNNDWIVFKNIDLKDIDSIVVRVASPNSGSRIEIREGSYDGGGLLGFILIPNTGSTANWKTVRTKLYVAQEKESNIYLVFKGNSADLLNINWLQFWSDGSLSTEATITSTEYTVSQADLTIFNVPKGTAVNTLENNLFPVRGATVKTYQPDGITAATEITEGCKVIVVAEDGINSNTYTIQLVTGINTIINDEVQIYPNPFSDYLIIKNNANSKLEIYNATGQKIFAEMVTDNSYTVSTVGLKPGIYIVTLTNEELIRGSKFIKE